MTFRVVNPPPLLFVLVMKYLSRILKSISELHGFKFHAMWKQQKLTHLFFADDLMIFRKGNLESVSRFIEALGRLSAVNGLIAKMEKSNLFLAGVDDATKIDCYLELALLLVPFQSGI